MVQKFKSETGEYVPLKDTNFRSLRWAILKGDLMPGERLREVPIANKFKVSRTPVREAIRQLEVEGLALLMPGGGAKVAEIEEKDLRDVLEVRIFLEKEAAELACEHAAANWLMECEAALELFYQAVCSRDIRRIAESDVSFHDMIFAATGNLRLIQAVENLKEPMYRYRLEYIKGLSDCMRLYEEHRNIYEAIKKRDKPTARKLVNEHIDGQKRALVVSM